VSGRRRRGLDVSALPLAEIRRRLQGASPRLEGRLLGGLREDPRRGARALAALLERRIAARRAEARRLSRLFARRRALFAGGARCVAGVDEVGVGPLAGPVVAAAVVLPPRVRLAGLNDSKQLRRSERERLDREIRSQALAVSLAEVPPLEIDRLNVYRAALEAMRRAVETLGLRPDHLLVDARTIPELEIPQTALVDGDARDGSIAAASIVAKVYRDALMVQLDGRHPGYGFARHKGYATREHLQALSRLGPSQVHRRSFTPVSQLPLF
jgi:ribonuclease HII